MHKSRATRSARCSLISSIEATIFFSGRDREKREREKWEFLARNLFPPCPLDNSAQEPQKSAFCLSSLQWDGGGGQQSLLAMPRKVKECGDFGCRIAYYFANAHICSYGSCPEITGDPSKIHPDSVSLRGISSIPRLLHGGSKLKHVTSVSAENSNSDRIQLQRKLKGKTRYLSRENREHRDRRRRRRQQHIWEQQKRGENINDGDKVRILTYSGLSD